MITGINSEDQLVQRTFAEYLEEKLGWESVYASNQETFGLAGTLGRTDTREVVLTRDLRNALYRLNRHLPPEAIKDAVAQLTQHDFSRSLLQHNRDFYRLIRDGVPVSYRDARGQVHTERARVIDFQNGYSGDGDNDKKAGSKNHHIRRIAWPAFQRKQGLKFFVCLCCAARLKPCPDTIHSVSSCWPRQCFS